MIELVCFYAVCLIQDHQIATCLPSQIGTKESVAKKLEELTDSGKTLVVECTKNGEPPSLTWFSKKKE